MTVMSLGTTWAV